MPHLWLDNRGIIICKTNYEQLTIPNSITFTLDTTKSYPMGGGWEKDGVYEWQKRKKKIGKRKRKKKGKNKYKIKWYLCGCNATISNRIRDEDLFIYIIY